MPKSDHKLDGASRLARNARTGVLTTCGIAAVVGLGSIGSPAQASFPGLNGKIICSGSLATELEPLPLPPGQSRLELFSINPDATGETRLMQNTNSDFSPRYSADGTKVAWVRDNDIWTMNADGTNQVGPLTNTANNTFMGDWSPDGTQLVFQTTRDGNSEVYKMNADGTGQVNLTNNATPTRNSDSQPAWSPDGTKIAFQSNRDGNANIHVMNTDGTNVVNVTADSLAEESAPRWSPDGSMIAFQSDRAVFPRPGVARNLEIYRMNADGSGATRLTFNDFDAAAGPGTLNLTGFDLNPAWSPDGTRIVFHSGRAAEFRDTGAPGTGIIGQWEAYHVDAVNGEGPGGAAPVRLTTRAGNDERCDWQPLAAAAAPPPAPAPPAPQPSPPSQQPAAGKFTAKLSIARTTINRRERVLDVLAPITARASGRVQVQLHAAGQRFRFTAPVDSANGRIRFRQRIPAAQARLGTGIVTISYDGDADTRPQTVRLRAASRSAELRLSRPRIVNGRVQASGTVSRLARGVVRLQLEYDRAGLTQVLRLRAPISNGRWSLNQQLSAAQLAAIDQRNGTLHSYTLFTGYQQERIRGEMRSFQVLGDR